MEVWGVSAIQGDKHHFCWSNYSDLTRPGPPNDGLVTEIFEISPKKIRLMNCYRFFSPVGSTPWKIDMELQNEGLVQMIFLFN